jgi:hypothetical protein
VVKTILHRRERKVRGDLVRCSNADFSARSANSAVKAGTADCDPPEALKTGNCSGVVADNEFLNE